MVLFLLSTFLFFVMRAVPGDVVRLQLADAGSVSDERMAEMEAELGLDRPALTQYGIVARRPRSGATWAIRCGSGGRWSR